MSNKSSRLNNSNLDIEYIDQEENDIINKFDLDIEKILLYDTISYVIKLIIIIMIILIIITLILTFTYLLYMYK